MCFPKRPPTMVHPRRLELLHLVLHFRIAAVQVVVSMAVVALASKVAYLHTRIHTLAVDPSFVA